MPIDLRPFTSHAEQQSAAGGCPHQQQLGPQLRKLLPQQGQGLRWGAGLKLRRQLGKAAPLRRQHRVPGGVPETVAGVPEGRQGHGLPQQAHPHGQPFSPDAVGGGRPEDHRQQQVDPGRGKQQGPSIDVGIKDAPGAGDALPRRQSQGQYYSRQTAGHGKGQQGQPQKMPFPAEGRQRQKHSRRCLCRSRCQKAPSRQKHRRRIQPAQQAAEGVPPPAQGDARQPGRDQHQEVIQQGVEEKHAVQIHHRHGPPPFQEDYRPHKPEKASQSDGPPVFCPAGFRPQKRWEKAEKLSPTRLSIKR